MLSQKTGVYLETEMAASTKYSSQTKKWPWRKLAILVILLIFLYVVVPQIKVLSPSIHSLAHARIIYILLAVCVFVATYFVAAVMYMLLRKHKLLYGRTLLVQVSSGFANRLLPAGLGGMGLIAQYLRSQGHTGSEAVTVVGMDNTIGLVGHFGLFFGIIALGNVTLTQLHLPHITWSIYFILVITAVFIALVVIFQRFRIRLMLSLKNVFSEVLGYRENPLRLMLAILDSILLTLLYVSILWLCANALRVELPMTKILIVFTAGALVGTATPTPGGLVGTEAGLFGGFVAYGVSDSTALAIALLYRLITYWLPIVPGLAAFTIAQRKLKLFG